MIRENQRRRDRNEKGPGGVRLADEFAELRMAKLDVSRHAAELVEQNFGRSAARMFAFRARVREITWYAGQPARARSRAAGAAAMGLRRPVPAG